MIIMADKNTDSDLVLNALLMLSFFEKDASMPEREKEQYKALISSGDATLASVFLLTFMLQVYAGETNRSKEETISYIRELLLKLSD